MFSQHRIFCFLHLISGNGAKTVFTRDFYIQDKVNTDYDNVSDVPAYHSVHILWVTYI